MSELRLWQTFAISVALAAAVLGFQVVRLSRLNEGFSRAYAECESALDHARRGTPPVGVGTRAGDILLLARSGGREELRLSAPEKPVLLLIVGHSCPSCREMSPLWAAVAERANACGVRTVTIDRQAASIADLPETYAKPLELVHVPALDTTWLANAFDVPAAYLIDAQGVVAWAWNRAITPGDIPGIVGQVCP